LVRRGFQTGLNQWQIEEPIILTAPGDSYSRLHQSFEDHPIAIQSI
jgi:hypothetical protein